MRARALVALMVGAFLSVATVLLVSTASGRVPGAVTLGKGGGGGGGSGTVSSIDCSTGLTCTPDPLIATGTIAIDSTVATLTGSQTLTNKTIGAATLTGTLTSATSPSLACSVADGATAVGLTVNTTNDLATAGARHVSFRNAGAEYLNIWDDAANQVTNITTPTGTANILYLSARWNLATASAVGSQVAIRTGSVDITPGTFPATTYYRFDQSAFAPLVAGLENGYSTKPWGDTWSNFYASGVATLSISSNTITPTKAICNVGAGLVKTITVPTMTDGGTFTGTITLLPTAAFTYDATGNILVPSGGGTAVVDKAMTVTFNGTKWIPSY